MRTTSRSIMTFLGSALLLGAACNAQPAADQPERPVIMVTGRASLSVPADQVRVSISVVSEGAEPREVIADNSQRVARVLDAIRRLGIGADDVSSGWFSIQPIYSQEPTTRRNQGPRIVGYRVNNNVIVETDKLKLAGECIQSAVDSGANRIDSVGFQLADERESRAEVLARAVRHARDDAEAVAGAAGVTLGPIASMSIDSPRQVVPYVQTMRMESMSAAGSAPPLIPGQIEVSASVTIEYEIQQ